MTGTFIHMKHLFLLLLCSTFSAVAAQPSGTIYNDLNQNGKKDAGEPGIAQVTVSDGYNVVKTDDKGNFTLPANEKGRFVFATIPSGFKAATRFYIKIDARTERYDIGLVSDAHQQKDQLHFIQVTDTETPIYGPWIDNVREYARINKIPLVMHTGDICYEPGMRFHAQQVNSELMGTTVNYAVGNHDLVKGEYGEKLYEDLFGPAYYSFECGPAYFVVTPMWAGDYPPSYTKDQVIAWLNKDLALKDADKPLIFVNHDFRIGPDFVLKGKEEETDLKQYNLKAWLFGHWHNNYVFKSPQYDVTVVSTNAPNKGGIDHAAGQFLHIEVNQEGITKISPVYTNLRSRIHLAPPVHSKGQMRFLANVYDSERKAGQVYITGLDPKGHPLFKAELKPQTDWAWEGTVPARSFSEALVEVHYTNGEHELRKQSPYPGKKGFQLKWSHNAGSNIWKSGPLVVGDIVLAASVDDGGNGRSALVAMDKKTGQRLWAFNTRNSVKQQLRSAGGIVLATDVEGNIYALDIKTGRQIWTKNISGGRPPAYVTAGAVYNNIYYTGYGSYLSAWDIASGKELWRNTEWDGGESMPGEIQVNEELLFTGANWNSLFTHHRETGKLLWKKGDDGLRFRSGGVAVENNEVYATGVNTLVVLEAKSGAVIRKKEYDHQLKVMASPLLLEDIVVVPNTQVGVSAYHKQSLERLWNFKTGEALIYTASYTTPDQRKLVSTVESTVQPYKEGLIFGASDGYIYFVDRQGQLLDKFYLGAPVLADIKVENGEIYAADFAGNVYCLTYAR